MKSRRLLTLVLAGAMFLSACTGSFKSNYFAPTAALVCGPVDCAPIAEQAVNDALDQTAAAAREAGTFTGPQGAQNRLDAQREILADMILREIGLQQAQVMGIQESQAAIDERVEEIRSQFESEEAFMQQLEAEGLTMAQLREFVSREVIFGQVQERVSEGTEPTVAEVEEFYDLNRSQYEAQVRIAHIVVCEDFDQEARRCTPSPSDEQLAADIVARARDGEDFGALAEQYSVDTISAMNGGELGYMSRGDLLGPLEEAAFNLFEVGTISEPVRTDFGLHIIKLLGFGQPLEAAREQITESLRQQKETKAFEDWLNDAINDSRINVNPRLGRFDKISRSVVPAAPGQAAETSERPVETPEDPAETPEDPAETPQE